MTKLKFFKFQKKEAYLYFLFYLSLLGGFLFGENSTGGAIIDYVGQKSVSIDFSKNFKNTFLNFDQYATRHSPVLMILLSGFEKLNLSDYVIRLIHLHLCLSLPLIFYYCLKEKYNFLSKEILIVLVGLIFISPTFRSLSIWPDSRVLGLVFFCLSLYFYIKFDNTKQFKYSLYNVASNALAAYFSPNFCVFSIFFYIYFVKYYGFFTIKNSTIILTNIIFALPAFYYVFILDINFFMKSAGVGLSSENILFRNLFNQLLIIPTLFLFYITPFLILRIIPINFENYKYSLIISSSIFLVSIYFFDYKPEYTGGGFYLKLSNYIFGNNIFFYLISIFSLIILVQLVKQSYQSIFIVLLILLNNPQETIYHKYYDPFLLIVFFLMFSFKSNFDNLKIKSNFLFVYLYFGLFLTISYFKIYFI